MNRLSIKKFASCLFLIFKKRGYRKKLKIPNLKMKEPAINSSPKGPDNLRGTASNPKMSYPKNIGKIYLRIQILQKQKLK